MTARYTTCTGCGLHGDCETKVVGSTHIIRCGSCRKHVGFRPLAPGDRPKLLALRKRHDERESLQRAMMQAVQAVQADMTACAPPKTEVWT